MNGQSCEKWRLLYDSPLPGARNMARDEALLRAVGAGTAPPTLRVYAWDPPTLSLGYGQPLRDVDEARLADRRWGLVRRLTGGRAILHTDELTYSITLPESHRLAAGSIIESYRRLSRALAGAAQALGSAPRAERAAERRSGTAVCFETPSHYELTVNGRKLVGSAQARRYGGVLQHGTLPLTGDLARIVDALAFSDELTRAAARIGVRARAATLEEAVGRVIRWDEAAGALAEAAAREFGVEFERGELTPAEVAESETLEREVYASRAWIARR